MPPSILRSALLALVVIATVAAQTPAPGLEGTWRGTLETPAGSLRLALRIDKSADGLLTGVLDSLDQGSKIPIESVTLTGNMVKLNLPLIKGTYEGTLNAARTEIKGTWSQGAPLPLAFTRDSSPTGASPAAPPAATPATSAAAPVTAAAFPLGLPLDLHVPIAPTPFLADDSKTYLVYELHVTNLGGRDFLISKVEVLAGQAPVAAYEGAELNGLMSPRAGEPERRIVAAGRRVVVFFFIPVDPAAVPRALRHRVTIGDLNVIGAQITVPVEKPIAIAPPLKGSGWRAANGPAANSVHRRAMAAIEGGARIAQRFAIDWVKTGADGRTFNGDAKDNKSYFAYGVDALGVADSTVVATKDGIPENVPGINSRAVPITLDTIGGNYVVLDLGAGRYAFYAHLQPGSLRVKTGDRVKAGQVLGLVGNSGNSTEPHLHFHVSNGISPLGSEGLPYIFPGGKGLPMLNTIVDFGQ